MEIAKPGELARDFLLKDQEERDHSLAAYKGRKVLLSFHPLAWTSICAEQMKALEAKKRSWPHSIPCPWGSAWTLFPARQPEQMNWASN